MTFIHMCGIKNIGLICLLSVLCSAVFGQEEKKDSLDSTSEDLNLDSLERYDYSQRETYEIGGVTVNGAESRDRNAIISIAGFKVGNKINIPGEDIPKAIRALWKLKLFEEVQILQTKKVDKIIFLEIYLRERPTLSRYSFKGIKKSQHDDINDFLETILTKGGIVTDDMKINSKAKIKEFYIEKGKLDVEVDIQEIEDKAKKNTVRLVFDIDTKDRVKVASIDFEGNTVFSDRKLRKQMSNTKKKGTLFRKTKYIKDNYEEDKKAIIASYNTKGYRDAKIVKDSVWRNNKGDIKIEIGIEEGRQYYFRNIVWKGNSIYTDDQLFTILGIVPGDIYNPELLEKRLKFSFDGRDISSLYLDDGYLFFQVEPTEVAIVGDSIDVEMRIYEGAQATINNVIIKGNDRTNEHVVRRQIRTKPGQKFSRSDIMRSQREIINLGYFNPESMGIGTPVNPANGTVDIVYDLEERPSDQLELSAGYGGFSGLIGTLGVTFNNFSLKNIKDRSTWAPLPQGDGQKLSLRVQSNSRFFRSYNFSFTEPWLGGKRPRSFTVGAVRSAFDYVSFAQGKLSISRIFAGLGTQLKWPDDFFSSNTTANIEFINLDNYARGQFFVDGLNITTGNFKNFSINQVFTRSSVSEPIYPRRGSRVSLSIQITPPYSLFRSDRFFELSEAEKTEAIRIEQAKRGPGDQLSEADMANIISVRENAEKFEFLEYHKWRFDAEWYFNIFSKFVIMANAKIGYVGAYDNDIGLSPFERFELGGDGLSNQNIGITGKDIISLRGYDVRDIEQNTQNNGGGTIFDKYTVELRYPLSLNPNSSIYLHTFLQGGNAWGSFSDFNPFQVKRSAGFGMRVFLPMFGLLGFDYGWGLDKVVQEGGSRGQFSIVLGFEPD